MAPQIQCKLKYWHLGSGATRRLLCSRKCGLSQCQGRSGLLFASLLHTQRGVLYVHTCTHFSIHRLMCCVCVLHTLHIQHSSIHSVACYMCVIHTLHIQQGCTHLAHIALHTQCGVLYVCITLLHTLVAHIAHHWHMLAAKNMQPLILQHRT